MLAEEAVTIQSIFSRRRPGGFAVTTIHTSTCTQFSIMGLRMRCATLMGKKLLGKWIHVFGNVTDLDSGRALEWVEKYGKVARFKGFLSVRIFGLPARKSPFLMHFF